MVSPFFGLQDAPHTGARLETYLTGSFSLMASMPPTRGHDLKLFGVGEKVLLPGMPPTRGHDLKPLIPATPARTS